MRKTSSDSRFLLCPVGEHFGANSTLVVRGTVTDPTGALIDRASVRLTSSKANYDQRVVTDEEGKYRFTDVPRAPFRLRVEAPRFPAANFKGDAGKGATVFYVIRFKGPTADI